MNSLVNRVRDDLLKNQGTLEQLLFPWHRSAAHRVFVVFLLVLIAFVVRRLIGPPELGVPFLTFFPAAAISAVFGGFWAGMLATALGSAISTYFFIPPYNTLSLEFRWDTVFANLVYILDEVVVCTAIAALHRVYLESKSQNAELNTLIRTIPDMVWLRKQDGTYAECNPAVERFYGRARADLIGRKAAELFPSQSENALHKLDQQALFADGPLTDEAWIVRESDGKRVLLEATVTPMRRSDGAPIGMLGIARDITGRRVLEDEVRARTLELERERRLLATIFEHTGDGIIAVDAVGRISMANHEARRLLGEPRPGSILSDFWPLWPTIAHAATKSDVRREIDANGRKLSLSVSALAGEYGAGHVIVARDVSIESHLADERRELDRQMFQMEKLATLGELAMGVAHEIGNPLGGMKAVVQSMQFGDELPLSMRGTVDRLEGEIDRLGAFLRTFRGVAATPRIQPSACRLRELVDDALFWVRKQAATQAVAIENAVGMNLSIQADAGQFKQVMLNLLVNAIHAMPEGGRLRVGARLESGGTVLIEVTDSGCGIDHEILTRIFDPFFTTRATGSGLGLAVVRKVVGDHGARIAVESEVGRGSCFSLYWPGTQTELSR